MPELLLQRTVDERVLCNAARRLAEAVRDPGGSVSGKREVEWTASHLLLTPATVQRMTTRDPKVPGTHFGLGVELDKLGWSHGGALTRGPQGDVRPQRRLASPGRAGERARHALSQPQSVRTFRDCAGAVKIAAGFPETPFLRVWSQ
jgi:hypothetical protein